MALTQVRAKFGTEWIDLSYNPSTGRYEGALVPPGTSFHQPGGYYPVTVEAANASGATASLSGEQFPALRLVVKEVTAPTLTLISPTPGFLNTSSPVFVFEAVDEAGGSGVDPGTAQTTLDGAVVPCTVEADGTRYRITMTAKGLSDGPHTVTAAISDYDGNPVTVAASYLVDTVPPVLILRKPDSHRVVDAETALVSADAWDLNGVTVTIGGQVAEQDGDRWSLDVPLAVGENSIPVVATDAAGNRTAETVYMIRLITDRVKNDVEFLSNILQKPVEEWSESTLEWFNRAVARGAYNDTDLNRVGIAVRYLAGELQKRGYIAAVRPKIDWTKLDSPTKGQMSVYLSNVETIRTAQGIPVTEIPRTIKGLTTDGANRIERALVETDSIFPRYTAWSTGEISCGES